MGRAMETAMWRLGLRIMGSDNNMKPGRMLRFINDMLAARRNGLANGRSNGSNRTWGLTGRYLRSCGYLLAVSRQCRNGKEHGFCCVVSGLGKRKWKPVRILTINPTP